MSGINLNDWAGLFFAGVAMSVALYGLSCAQTIFYYKEYPEDSLLLKLLVGFVWILDSARTIMDVSSLWFWIVQNHTQFSQLIIIPGEFAAEFFFCKICDRCSTMLLHTYYMEIIGRQCYTATLVALGSGASLSDIRCWSRTSSSDGQKQ